MENKQNQYKIFCIAVIAVSLISAALRTVLLALNLRVDSVSPMGFYPEYYLPRTAGINAFDGAIAVVCIACVVFAVKIGKNTSPSLDSESYGVIFASSLSGFLMLSTGLYLGYRTATAKLIPTEQIFPIVLTILSSVTFFYYSSKRFKSVSKTAALFGLIPVALAAVRLITDYYLVKDYPQSAVNIYHFLSLAVLIVFLINEGKFAVGRGNPSAYIASGSVSVVLLSIFAIPDILLAAFTNIPITDMTLYSALDIAFSVYIITRILTFKALPDNRRKESEVSEEERKSDI